MMYQLSSDLKLKHGYQSSIKEDVLKSKEIEVPHSKLIAVSQVSFSIGASQE